MREKIKIIIVLATIMGLITGCGKEDPPKQVVTVNNLEIQLYTSQYHDIEDAGYIKVDERGGLYKFRKTLDPYIYILTNSSGSVKYEDEDDCYVYYVGLDIDESVRTLKIDDLDILNTSKEELEQEYEVINYDGLDRFTYKEHNFICLSYNDNDELDGFAVMYNSFGESNVRDVDLIFRDYKDCWME